MSRVAAIAIDAAEWWYVERLIARGMLPNLARLRDRSAQFTLQTPIAFRSELVWARFLSGKEPLDDKNWAASMTFDPDTYAIGSNTASREKPFYAFGPGTKVLTLDLIHCALADDVDGAQVVAWGSHSPQFPRSSRPAGLLTEIDERFGTNPAFDNESGLGWYQADYIDALADASAVGLDRRAQIGRWMLEQHPDWDLFLMCMSEVHGAEHLMWHGADERSPLHGVATSDVAGRRLEDVFVAADRALGTVLDALPEDTNVVVFAMHGAQPADDLLCTVLLPELLFRHHTGRALLLDPDQEAWRRAGCPPVVPEPDYPWGEYLADRFADTPKQQLRRAIRAVLPRSAFEALRRAAGRPVAPPLSALPRTTPPETFEIDEAALDRFRQPADYQPAAWYSRHWPSMPSFGMPSFADGHIRLNVTGRERHGIVPVEDYERACDEVEALLAACRDARTGAPVLGDAIRARGDDPLDPDGPDCDLLVIWDGAPDAITHPELGTIGPFPHVRTSHHTTNGFAFVSGPGIQPGPAGERMTRDLTATVCALLGKRPAQVQGESLVQLV